MTDDNGTKQLKAQRVTIGMLGALVIATVAAIGVGLGVLRQMSASAQGAVEAHEAKAVRNAHPPLEQRLDRLEQSMERRLDRFEKRIADAIEQLKTETRRSGRRGRTR